MPFGIDDVFYILAAAQAANSIANPPENPTHQTTPGAAPKAAQSRNVFELPGATPVKEPKAVEIDEEVFAQAAQQAASMTQGPPPTVPLQPTPPPGEAYGPRQEPQAAQAPAGKGIGEILAATPQALAAVSGLLGIGQPQEPNRQTPAPIPGGTAGQVVQGFSLPQNIDIGTILSQIPRLR
jgi:hypothetical protein